MSLLHSTVSLVCSSQLNTLRDIRSEGEVGQYEEQLKFNWNLLKPFVIKVIELKARSLKPFSVQNFYHTINNNALSSVTLYTNVNCKNTRNSSDELQQCSSLPPKFQTLTFTLTLRTVTFV